MAYARLHCGGKIVIYILNETLRIRCSRVVEAVCAALYAEERRGRYVTREVSMILQLIDIAAGKATTTAPRKRDSCSTDDAITGRTEEDAAASGNSVSNSQHSSGPTSPLRPPPGGSLFAPLSRVSSRDPADEATTDDYNSASTSVASGLELVNSLDGGLSVLTAGTVYGGKI